MNYSQHSHWSNSGEFKEALFELPDNLTGLADALESFLIHHVAARSQGFGVPEYAESDRQSRSVVKLLEVAMSRDARPLSEHRDLPDYLYVVCRDFSLIATSILRSRGVAARLRVGFVDYLVDGFWEDHWVCEYYLDGQWRLFDPQMGVRARKGLGIQFAINDLPRSRFKSGAEMWLDLRSGQVDSRHCGVSFVKELPGDVVCVSNLLRDAAGLSKVEMLAWDFWGISRECIEHQQVDVRHWQDLGGLTNSILALEKILPISLEINVESLQWALPENEILTFVGNQLVERRFAELYA